jgi:hypothetical protein
VCWCRCSTQSIASNRLANSTHAIDQSLFSRNLRRGYLRTFRPAARWAASDAFFHT